MQENENARNKAARNREGEKPEAVTGTGASAGEPYPSHDRLNHIYRVLLGIRNVNQLIVTEDDPRRLIEKACVNLTETMGYHNAWIALLGGEAAQGLGLTEPGPLAAAAAAGFDGGFECLRERLDQGAFPDCMTRALEAGEVHVVDAPAVDCPDCPLHSEYGGRAGLARRLAFDGVTYGILTASVPADYARDAEEQNLFNEVANDLAFALHKIAAARRHEQSQQRMSLVIDGSGLGTWEWNVQTNETVFNEHWAAMLGYTLEELTPCDYTTWERLVHPEDLPRASQALSDCVAGRTTDYTSEFRMKHKDGHWVWILDRGRVMTRDDEGKALAMFGTHTDISGIKQAEEEARNERDLSRSIIEHGPVGITIVTRDGVVEFANRLAEEILGLSKSAIRGRTYNDSDWKITAVDGTQFSDEHLPVRRVLQTGEAVHGVQHAIVWPNGQRRFLSVNAAPLKNREGCIDRIVCAIEDITERKGAEEALRESESRVRSKLNALLDPEGDIGTLNLADVVDCDQIQSLMNDFHALTDIGVGILDLEGNVLVGTGWQDVCTKFHRVHPEAARNCIESDTLLASGVAPGTFKVYKCKNNMWDMATPIVIGERHVGNLFLGQFLFDDEEPNVEVFREQAHRYGFDEEAYLEAYRSIPRWSKKTVHEVMTFYANLIGVIARLSYAHIKLARASEALRQSEQRFRSFVENANDMVYALSPEGVFTYMSPNWLEFMGEPAEEAIGKSFEPYVHPEDVHLCRAFLEKTLTTGEKQSSVEYRVRHQDGSWRWHVSNGSPIRDESGTVTGFVGIGRDVTEAKRAEEALKASEVRFKEMLRNVASVAVQGYAMDGTVRYWNEASETFYGYTAEEAIGRNLLDLIIPPTMRDRVSEAMRRMAETGEAMPASELELMRKDGSSIQVYSSHTLVQMAGQEPELFCIDIDLSERKRAEEALSESEQRFQRMLGVVPDMISIHSPQMDILYSNWRGFAAVPNEKRIANTKCYKTYRDRDSVCPDCRADRVLETGQPFREEVQLPEGQWVDLRIIPLLDKDSNVEMFMEWVRDVTEKKQADEERERLSAQLGQAQKLESVGRLAGGVAHDFNNMLGVILGQSEMMLGDLPADSSLRGDLDEIRKAAERSADLTRQLLAFARKQTVAPKVLDLNEAVASMLKMLERLIGEDIDLLWRLATRLAPVRIDPGQVDQMLANLAVNARDAIGHANGKITIETADVCLDEAYCAAHTGFLAGDYVMLAVSDDGCGMDEETRSKVFEPFFTTKGVGEGTGLGLSTVYGIVTQNNGFANVYSEPGKGTTFRIYLPAANVDSLDNDKDARSGATSRGGNETILVVEDEAAILNLARMMLEPSGYTVLTASGPGEALRVARDYDGTIDLLITDVVMPEMNGRALSEKLQAICPGLRSLFMSGYTANVIAHHSVLDEGVDFVQKPFSQNDLCKKVREVLDT